MALEVASGVDARDLGRVAGWHMQREAPLQHGASHFEATARKILSLRALLRGPIVQVTVSDNCWDVLLTLYLRGELTVTDLRATAGQPLTTTLRLLELLEQQELVVRRPKPGDRRAVLVRISAKALNVVEAMLSTVTTQATARTQQGYARAA